MDAVTANDYYWNMLKGLSDERKIDLIDRLARSLSKKEKKQEDFVTKYFGIWKDEDFPSADDMVKEIRESRQFKDDTIAF